MDLISSHPSKSKSDRLQIANIETLILGSTAMTGLVVMDKKNEELLQRIVTEILRKHNFLKHILKGHVIAPEVKMTKFKPKDVWIPLYEVHCPVKEGATAKLSKIKCHGKSKGLQVEIFGIGGQFNSSFTDCIATEVHANHEGCMIKKRKIIMIPHTFEIKCEKCNFTTGEKNEVTCVPTEDTLQDFIPEKDDPCRSSDLLKSLKKGPLNKVLRSFTNEVITSTKEKLMEFSFGITSPFAFKAKGAVSSKQTISYSYHLVSPCVYTIYKKKKIPRGWKISKP